MGTRSLTKIYDRNEIILCIYRQFDGYPEAHGAELFGFIESTKLVNGLGRDDKNVSNGMGCFAAQLVAHLKTEAGNIYIYPANSNNVGEEFEYYIRALDGKIELSYCEIGLNNEREQSKPLTKELLKQIKNNYR